MIKFQSPKVVQGFFHPQYGSFLSHGRIPKSSKLDYFSVEIHHISLFARNPWEDFPEVFDASTGTWHIQIN